MAAAAGSGGGRSAAVGAVWAWVVASGSSPFGAPPLPKRPSSRAASSRCFWLTTNRPTKSALPNCCSTRRRPSAISSGISSATDMAIPIGAMHHTSKVCRSGLVCDCPPSGSSSSDTIPAEHPLRVCQLARVLDQETRTAHELVGLLGQDPLVALGLVLLVGRFFVLGLVLDDQALLEDHIQAGLDVLVVGLLFLLLVVAVAGFLHDCSRRRRQDFVDLVGYFLVLVVDVDSDHVVIVVFERVDFEVVVVNVNLEVVVLDDLLDVCFGGLSHHFFGLGLLLRRHCAAGA